MAVEIRVPTLGESIVDAVVVKWLKQPGETVARSEPIVELETDKVNVEVPADQAGVIESIARKEGDTVAVGEVLGTIDPSGVAAAAPAPAATTGTEIFTPAQPEQHPEVPAAEAAPATETAAEAARRAGPAVRKLAAERSVDLAAVAGSGPGGRIRPEDVTNYSAPQQPAPAPAPVAAPQSQPAQAPAAPSLNGRSDREERVRMSRRRQTIATRLVEAQQTAAMLTTFNEVDMTAIMEVRKQRRDAFKERHGVGLGFMSFFTKASIGALKAFPRVNAEIQGDEIVYKRYYDIGIAVGADEGLVVPVVRDADRKTFAEIEAEIVELATKVRENTLAISDLQGGTFTITNGGNFGSMLSTPILNTPQVGILGMHRIQERPVVREGQIVARPMMYLALSYDHRLVDGREAVQFLVRVKDLLEDPETLLLDG
ncbi:MAG TPA: 2-oxoglutarate dehydrogenase complex dihydrolipoyllysine-residue succinyltransferase [Thermomicrobiales bacterium]|nr:2-oxoglutarate dehydrogenase complex dihydrolipoyllysine-residue succinyltransferase [Thermomicrobiales bacterium]